MTKTYLVHHGIKGQRWGVRRYQNEDGSLTPEGVTRYGTVENMEKSRSRNKKILIGVGAAAAVAGSAYVLGKNRRLKNEIEQLKLKESMRITRMQEGKKAAAAKRAADIAAGLIPPTKIRIKAGSNLIVSEYTATGSIKAKEYLKVIGGYIVKAGGN